MAFKPEVQTAGNGDKWSSNELKFATRKEAERYVSDLEYRWTAVTSTRVTEVDAEPTYRWNPDSGKAEQI